MPKIPESLDTTEFRLVWAEWQNERRERGKRMTERAMKMQLKKLAEYGVDVAIQTIEASIENGWTGVFPERFKSSTDFGGIQEWLNDSEA